MNFLSPGQDNDRVFNNADSFSSAFDTAWHESHAELAELDTETDTRIDHVLSKIAEHPFLLNNPDLARQVVQFRLRMLNIQ